MSDLTGLVRRMLSEPAALLEDAVGLAGLCVFVTALFGLGAVV
jgi:hypothetical protein